MTVKRTRTSNEPELERSNAAKSTPSQGFAAVKSISNQAASQLPFAAVAPSPVLKSADDSSQLKLGGFLERCQYCKKRIPEGVEVFMYKDFCAFCSAGCREIQISLDKLAERQPERVIHQHQEMKHVNSQFG